MSGSADAALSEDGFLGGRLRLLQPRDGYRAAIDPVLLAAFAPADPGARVLDLGCGVGAAALCLGARTPGLDLHGLELQPAYADLARRNAAVNAIAVTVHEGDLRHPPRSLRAAPFDLVMLNPPFHDPAGSVPSRDPGRDLAHREGAAGLADWIAAALRWLRPGGALALVHFPARLPGVLAALDGPAGAIEVLPVAPRAGRPASRILVRALKGRRTPLRLLAPLVLHEGRAHDRDRDSYAAAAAAVLRGAARLPVEHDPSADRSSGWRHSTKR